MDIFRGVQKGRFLAPLFRLHSSVFLTVFDINLTLDKFYKHFLAEVT